MAIGGAIELEKLVKRYGSHVAVDQVSLNVASGEFVTLLGASGSGKTTTLMMIAGFVLPDSGRISINNNNISNLPPEKRGLGVVFQSYALFPHLNVFENVAFPLRLRRMPFSEIQRNVKRTLELVDLASYQDRRVAQLSGGQQQRVALARAMVFSPPVLLMDEPLGALDRRLRDQLQIEIKRIQRDLGVTVIYVTHDQEEALALSDRIAIMTKGRIEQLGTPDLVYREPVSPSVASFLGESNLLSANRIGVDGQYTTIRLGGETNDVFRGRLARPNGEIGKGGQAVVAMVRPEAIRILAEGEAAPGNSAVGRVESREFMGATVRFQVKCPFGSLLIRVSRMTRSAEVGVGERVRFAWAEQDMLIFSATDAPRSQSEEA